MISWDLSEVKASGLPPSDEVQAFFQQLVEKGAYSFTAHVDENGITYPEVAAVFPNLKEEEIESLLDKLRSNGLLDAKLLDKVSICPACGGTKSYPKYYCPRCSSLDVGRASIIEHFRCGYIGSEESFRQGNEIICPKCKSELRDVDFRRIGTAFECKSCHTRFESPRVSNKCSSCGNIYTFREGKYISVYSYKISESAKNLIAKESIPLAPIISYLRNHGFEVGLDKTLDGKSGASHDFRIVAHKAPVFILADFAFEAEENAIIRLFAKKYDLSPTLALLIALLITFTEPSDSQQKISSIYGVNILALKNGSLWIEEEMDRLIERIERQSQITEKQKEIIPPLSPTVEAKATKMEEQNSEPSDSFGKIFFEDEELDSTEL